MVVAKLLVNGPYDCSRLSALPIVQSKHFLILIYDYHFRFELIGDGEECARGTPSGLPWKRGRGLHCDNSVTLV
jgi:hypothetical protein